MVNFFLVFFMLSFSLPPGESKPTGPTNLDFVCASRRIFFPLQYLLFSLYLFLKIFIFVVFSSSLCDTSLLCCLVRDIYILCWFN
uniref:Uncharacterized protein n=1 Tax=Solanum lycopersicum TaxID=4081 RepID=A0A3Q7GC07_SOLLC